MRHFALNGKRVGPRGSSPNPAARLASPPIYSVPLLPDHDSHANSRRLTGGRLPTQVHDAYTAPRDDTGCLHHSPSTAHSSCRCAASSTTSLPAAGPRPLSPVRDCAADTAAHTHASGWHRGALHSAPLPPAENATVASP